MAAIGVVEILGGNLKRILLPDGWHTITNVQIGKGVYRQGDATVALSMSGEFFLSFTEGTSSSTVVPLSAVLAFEHA